MRAPHAFCLIAGGVIAAASPVLAEQRDWTRANDGKIIRAEFAGMKDEKTVKIRMVNGHVFEVPLTSLSEADAVYVKNLVAKKVETSAAAAPVPEGETTLTLSGVHLCCAGCEDAVTAIGSDPKNLLPAGVALTPDRKTGTITVTAPSGKDAQAALRAVLESGYYGASDHEVIKIADLKPDDSTVDTMTLTNLHLCCGSCVKALTKAVESVEGVKAAEAKSGADRAIVTGTSFKTYEVMQALREAGFGGSFR